MKNIKYILSALLLVMTFYSCYDDKGNYNYLSNEEVGTIKIDTAGVPNKYEFSYNHAPGDTIQFEPHVDYKYPERLTYRWFYLTLTNYTYQALQQGNAMVYPPADTISSSKKLDWIVNLPAGQYRFYCMAKDTVSGQMAFLQPSNYTTIAMTGTMSGLYLLSEYNGQTDIDVYGSALMLIVGGDKHLPKYYSQKTGSVIPGKPVFIHGTHTGKSAKNGYMVITDQTMRRLNAVGLQTMDNWNDMFFETPSSFKPQALTFINNCEFLINDGKLHVLYTSKTNNRKFSAPIAGDYVAADYLALATKTSWRPTTGAIGADQVIYDTKNKCFRPYFAYQSSIGSFKATAGDACLDANKLPANPKAIFNGYSNRTYCIVPDSNTYFLYRFNFYNRVDNGDLSADGKYSKTKLAGCTDIGTAKYFCASSGGHAFFYATDKGVYSFSPSTGQTTSKTIYTCASNEEVTAINILGTGGFPVGGLVFWVALWDSTTQQGKLLEYEVDNNSGLPQWQWGSMFAPGHTEHNPYITTGWGKIKSMTCISAEAN